MRKFTANNQEFSCQYCNTEVPLHPSSSRNHCPFCLHSLHVDLHPGDRQNTCKGLMAPTGYKLSGKKGLVLEFRCLTCGEQKVNISAPDDDYDLILRTGAPV